LDLRLSVKTLGPLPERVPGFVLNTMPLKYRSLYLDCELDISRRMVKVGFRR